MNHNHNHTQYTEHTSPQPRYLAKDFIPLVAVFGVIILFTYITVLWNGVITLDEVMRTFMAGFFIVFGSFKVAKWRGFANAYQMYDLIAKRSKVYAYLYPLIELALGIAYLIGWNLFVTNSITIVVMLVSAAGVFNELRKKNQIPCACLGTVFVFPMTYVTLFEDLLMVAMATAMLL